jgi:hypothetical protein
MLRVYRGFAAFQAPSRPLRFVGVLWVEMSLYV